jgi:beta-lactamase class A
MRGKHLVLVLVAVAILAGATVGWTQYQRTRAAYDEYQTLIQPGITIAGVAAGWLSPEEAAERVTQEVAAPYFQALTLHYGEATLDLSPAKDLGLTIPVEEMVAEAVAASHTYDYWLGFREWIQGRALTRDLAVPLRIEYDETSPRRLLRQVAAMYDVAPREPMVDIQARTFIPGLPGRELQVQPSAVALSELVLRPEQREVTLTVEVIQPDQSPARIESMLATLVPVMAAPPIAPSFFTATLPLSTTMSLPGTSSITHTGELTWSLPHFASYTGPLTSTYGFFFDPGQPGFTFDVDRATRQVLAALQAGRIDPISFEADLVPPPPVSPSLLLPPLEARLASFQGVASLLVKNLDTGELIYSSNVDYVLAGMSVVKMGIMVEVYRHYRGEIDAQTLQELYDMMGSESCNPCANRLMEAVGGGSARAGAQAVTNTMRRLGLANFYLCAPFRIVDDLRGREVLWVANAGRGLLSTKTPRYDPCVKATPREMADLLEMIFEGAQGRGLLPEAYPDIFLPETCSEMLEIMAANDLRNMLGAGIPAEVKLAHKHGFAGYNVSWGDTRAEVGIVFSPGATWLVTFYIWDDTPWLDYGLVQPLYRDVSNLLYNYFNPAEPYWPLPPWTPPPESPPLEDA